MEKTIRDEQKKGRKPSLLLHACCAPCSSYVLEYLSNIFNMTVFFYNPNISPKAEYETREAELFRLVKAMELEGKVKVISGEYEPRDFYDATKGMEELPEGSERCRICYRLRLSRTAKEAARGGYDYFTTTLSISPYKNAEWLTPWALNIYSLTSKRKTATNAPVSFPRYTVYTVRISAAVYILNISENVKKPRAIKNNTNQHTTAFSKKEDIYENNRSFGYLETLGTG